MRSTTSPSSSSTRRSTPCAAGCCGPKFMVKLRNSLSAIPIRHSLFAARHRSATRHSLLAPLSGRHHRLLGLLRLLREARMELVPGHDVTLMTTLTDRVDAVVRLDFEGDARALDRHALDLDRHRQSRRRGRGMADVDVHADTPLAGVEVG